MERNGGIRSVILMCAASVLLSASCSSQEGTQEAEVMIRFSCAGPESRASMPDEETINDISLMIFDRYGSAEECLHLENGAEECPVRLIAGEKYTFCACANLGRQVYAADISELDDILVHLAYPDDYRHGIPMYACQEIEIGRGCREIPLMLERLMAKISLKVDRRELSEDVAMHVRSVRIGNCPRRAAVFRKNMVTGPDDCFPAGFSLYDEEASALNETTGSGMSREVSLYMLENMQGKMKPSIDKGSEKVFDDDDYRSRVCSYIEMEMDYMSGDYMSLGKGLIYRFYLGENLNDLNVGRNCHYHITIVPEDDGLGENSWRVDKSGLSYCGPTKITGHPSGYINGDIGDRVHIWCRLIPDDAPFDVGMDDMEFDKSNGIYDYEVDADGHGAVLTLTGPGTGLIYMEAGPPINDGVLFYIEVNLPEESGQETPGSL